MGKFESGVPACPVACSYCFITEHDARREVWNQNSVAGINKACTFVNVTPWIDSDPLERERFSSFPWEVLKGDFVGFTAITDPFFPKIERYLWDWVERATAVAKLTTCVTKWPVDRRVMERLSQIPNFYLVIGITGNETLERVSTKKHLETLALAKELGVRALPIAHPYIAGVSNLDFLPAIKDLGYDYFDVKGLRYCEATMGHWMPDTSKPFYQGREEDEILPEDGWRQMVADAGLQLLSPREWYRREGLKLSPNLVRSEAEELVKQVFALANVVSSDSNSEVFKAAVERRL
jgi:DNA repair photolyase